MSTEKKKEQQLLEDVAAQPAAQSSYSTAGLNSRKEVENALTNAVYTPGQSVTDAAADLRNWQQNRPGKYESAYQGRIEDLIGQLLERNSFQYSYAQDPLYRQYAGSTPRTPATPARTPPHRLRPSPAATAPAMRSVRPSRRTSSRWAR